MCVCTRSFLSLCVFFCFWIENLIMYFCLRFCIRTGNTLYLYRRQQIQLLVWAEQFFNWFYGDVCFIHELQLFYTQISRLFRYNILHPTQESGSCIVFACISSRCRFSCCIRLCIIFNRFVLKFTLLISISIHVTNILFCYIGGQGILLGLDDVLEI